MQVYYALVESKFAYGIIAWGGSYGNKIKLVEKIQRRIVKVIQYKYKIQPNITDKSNNVLSLKNLYYLSCIKHNFIYLMNEYNKVRNKRAKNIKPIYKNKEIGKKSNLVKAVYIFNKLPIEIKNNIGKNTNNNTWFKKVKIWLYNYRDN